MSTRGHVRSKNGRYWVDRRQKLGSIIPNEIVLFELQVFLHQYYSEGAAAILDIGAGTKPYAIVYREVFLECTSVDLPGSLHDVSDVDVFARAEDLPFDAQSYDCVLCTEVLEHCADPAAALREIARVLKPGGRAFVTTPFLVAEHEMPQDYYRFTPSALRLLAEEAGLAVLSVFPKGEYFAVAIGTFAFPWSKMWQLMSRKLEVDLYHPYNPFVFVPLLLPQILYVALWKRMRRTPPGFLSRLHQKLSYVTLGYITTLEKVPEMDAIAETR